MRFDNRAATVSAALRPAVDGGHAAASIYNALRNAAVSPIE